MWATLPPCTVFAYSIFFVFLYFIFLLIFFIYQEQCIIEIINNEFKSYDTPWCKTPQSRSYPLSHACTYCIVVHCKKNTPYCQPWSSCSTLHSVSSPWRKLEYTQFRTPPEEEEEELVSLCYVRWYIIFREITQLSYKLFPELSQ